MAGFSLSFDPGVSDSMLWSESPASAASLQVGQQIHSINGAPASRSCAGIQEAMQAIRQGDSIELGWEGGGANLKRANGVSN